MSLGALEAGGSYRMLGFLITFRWVAFLVGLLSLLSKESTLLVNLQLSGFQQILIFTGLTFYQLAASLFTAKGVDGKFWFLILFVADITCGAFLIYFCGNSFFLMAAFVPLLETAFFYPASTVVTAAFLAIIISILLALNLLQVLNDKGGLQQFAKQVLQQLILGILMLWLFLRLFKECRDVLQWQKKGVDEKHLLLKEMEAFEHEREVLIRELREMQTQNVELEQREKFSRSQIERLQNESDSNLQKFFDREQELMHRLDTFTMEIEGFQSLIAAIGSLYRTYALDDTLVTVVELVTKSFSCQTCVLFLVDEMNGEKRLFAEAVGSPYANIFKDFNIGFGEEAVGWAVTEGEPVLVENVDLHTVNGMHFTTLLASERSCIVIPLLTEKEPVGAIYIGGVNAGMYSWREVDLLMKLAPHLAGAIKKAQIMHQKVSLAMADETTGLFNSQYFNDRLAVELKRARRYHTPLSLIFLEIDQFEYTEINYGKSVSHGFLKEITGILKIHVRDIDVSFYLEHGRFGILLVQAQKNNAVLIAERVRLAIDMRRFGLNLRQKMHLTVSVGVADVPENTTGEENLIEKAEQSLAEAKAKGGNTTCFAA